MLFSPFKALEALKGRGWGRCCNLQPPVLVATQNINKRRTPSLRGLPALWRGKDWACFNKSCVCMCAPVCARPCPRPSPVPRRFAVLGVGDEKRPCDYLGELMECIVMQSRCRSTFTFPASIGCVRVEECLACVFENWPPGLGHRPCSVHCTVAINASVH